MFDKLWFRKHQRILLWFANTRIGRKILCIDGKKSSVGKNKIVGILPNAIFWKAKGKRKYTAEFRTHDKFAKRIYYAFKPIWHLIHLWDILFANNLNSNWNLGFDSFGPAYPDPDPESATVDGDVYRQGVDETFSNIRSGAGTLAFPSIANDEACGLHASTTSSQYSAQTRSIYLWDTSSIPSGSSVSASTLSLYGQSTASNGLGSTNCEIVSSSPASNTNLVTGDYAIAGFGSTSFGNISTASWAVAYNDVTLNASGRSNIATGGISKFGALTTWDMNNSFTGSWASSAASVFYVYFADQTGTANDPKLTATYTLPIKVSGGYAFVL